jgi:hypothetical protein
MWLNCVPVVPGEDQASRSFAVMPRVLRQDRGWRPRCPIACIESLGTLAGVAHVLRIISILFKGVLDEFMKHYAIQMYVDVEVFLF